MSRRHHPSSSPRQPGARVPRAGHPPSRRHDLGQNDLIDRDVIRTVVTRVAATRGPIVELAAGLGRLTVPLAALGRPITAIELDPRRAADLRSRVGAHVRVVEGDVLRTPLPSSSYVLVGNLPFHLTTAIVRRVLAQEHWSTAALIMQWEAARRRAGIEGGSQLTAQWLPWFEFELDSRIASTAFRPRPAVDAALLCIHRRATPLVPVRERSAYQRWVAEVFAVPGTALIALARADRLARRAAREKCRRLAIDADRPVSRLTAEQWSHWWASRP